MNRASLHGLVIFADGLDSDDSEIFNQAFASSKFLERLLPNMPLMQSSNAVLVDALLRNFPLSVGSKTHHKCEVFGGSS